MKPGIRDLYIIISDDDLFSAVFKTKILEKGLCKIEGQTASIARIDRLEFCGGVAFVGIERYVEPSSGRDLLQELRLILLIGRCDRTCGLQPRIGRSVRILFPETKVELG